MVCRIAFLGKPDEPFFSGKSRSTQELVQGLKEIGVNAIYTENAKVKSDYYAVDCLDDLDLLPSDIDNSRLIAWVRRDVTKPLTERFEFSRPGHLFCSSQSIANLWEDYCPIVLPDCIGIPKLKWNVKLTAKRLLYVGRVCRSKGLPLLFKTLSSMHDHQWHLDVIGPISYDFSLMLKNYRIIDVSLPRKEKYNMILGVGYPNHIFYCGPAPTIKFHGPLSYDRVSWFYRMARIVVVPSQFEPFGRAVIEALAHGRPAIAIQGSGGPDEILPYSFMSPHCPVQLGAAIRRIHQRIQDVSNFQDQLLDLASKYDRKTIAKQFMDHLCVS